MVPGKNSELRFIKSCLAMEAAGGAHSQRDQLRFHMREIMLKSRQYGQGRVWPTWPARAQSLRLVSAGVIPVLGSRIEEF